MLETLNNRTYHTHENEQFCRVVNIIELTFEKLGYNGLLIGNPFNELYSRFLADAILYYNNGLILIDFKDYRGIIKLPPNENDFYSAKWHNESPKDRSRLEIKAGSNFINPFRQLVSYRKAFRELIDTNKYFDGINSAQIFILNIFSGPIEIHNEIPGELCKYYKLIQESELGNFLNTYGSNNTYTEEIAKVFKIIFPAEKWINNIDISIPEQVIEKQIIEIDDDVENNIVNFLKEENGGILVLESMNAKDRDSWLQFITNKAVDYDIPQIEKWSYSTRISNKIHRRSNIKTEGIYSVIYGGSDIEEQNDNSDKEDLKEELLEVIPLKSSKDIDEKALIVVTEAHLISRSLNQSELMRFGSGRILEDIIMFLNPESKRKIIFIGDPYSLTYGKDEDSALDLNTLSELYNKYKIKHFRKHLNNEHLNGKDKLLTDLAISIENSIFNNLNYSFDEFTLNNLQDDKQIKEKLYLWFSEPFSNEPNNAILFYSKKDCLITNKWIKKNCLKNGETIGIGDLLIVNNNVIIPDESGFNFPRRILNGMFLTVLAVKESFQEIINIHQAQKEIILSFTKISVKCLSLLGSPETDIWILNNYFNTEDNLTKKEQIAFRVFVNKKLNAEKSKNKFINSNEYCRLLEDSRYKNLSNENKQFIKDNYNNLRMFKKEQDEAKEILKLYRLEYDKNIFIHLKNNDPIVNSAFVKYGWAITCHKAVGSNYNEIIIKGHRGENNGITNDSYFRWLYSGVSVGKIVNITSPQIINPFIYSVFEDISTNGFSSNSKQFLFFENYEAEIRIADKVQTLDNKNVVGAICELSKTLEQNGYLLESSKKYSEYLTKAFYTIPQSDNKLLILNIDNKGLKGNYGVGNIRIENLNGANESIIKRCIEDCFKQNQSIISISDEKSDFPKDFRKEIYSAWFEKCENENITMKLIQSHNNQDVFRTIYKNESLTLRVWYSTSENKKGFFSKIEVLEKTSENFLENIKEIIYGL